ncbi:MAG: glyceraldehyde-3-phosphate dehydrogenase, partial [Microbacteriaceae bacterium]|nr:glyceraldehyde-3-phosphate dehydrogenase [Microbacteriaceae bacterium]
MSTSAYEDHRSAWVSREELAERLIPLIGRLYRDYGVVTSVHGHRIINLSAMGVIEAHERVLQLGHQELSLEQSRTVLEA